MLKTRRRLAILFLETGIVIAAGIAWIPTYYDFGTHDASPTAIAPIEREFAVLDGGADLNFVVRNAGPIHLFWNSGTPPFQIFFDLDGRRRDLITTTAHHLAFEIPDAARKRFAVIVKDEAGLKNRVLFRIRDKNPLGENQQTINPERAKWLAQRHNGVWYLHVLSAALNMGDAHAARDLAPAGTIPQPH